VNVLLDCALSVGYTENHLEGIVNTKFLGLQIDIQLNWKNNTDHIIPNLSGACYYYDSQITLFCMPISIFINELY
jgi:hypothetical protein